MDRINQLRTFLKDNPDDSFLKHALALEYVKLGDDEQAKALFENILGHDENYIGSYYHLCQLLVRINQKEEAIKWYRKGMEKAKLSGDHHAYNELLNAYEDQVDQ
jgi:Tfp pilus assembly protein PilF